MKNENWTEQEKQDIAAANRATDKVPSGGLVISCQHAFATELRLRGWPLEKAVKAMYGCRYGSDNGHERVDDYYATLQAYRARGYNALPQPGRDFNEMLPVASEAEANARREAAKTV